MLHKFLILLFFPITPILAEEVIETDCNNPRDTPGYSNCAYYAYMTADQQLNDVYKQLTNNIKGDEKKLLITAQKAWIQFRDANCDFETFNVRGGTGWSTYHDECLERMTLQRTSELQNVLRLSMPISYSFSIASTDDTTTLTQLITTVSNARVRTAPNLSAKQMVKLPIGSVITQLGISQQEETINGVVNHWHQVSLSDGRQGWIFGDLLQPLLSDKKATIYLNIAHERLAKDDLTFEELIDLFRFLARVSTEQLATDAVAELKLLNLLALQRSVTLLPLDEEDKSPYKQWLEEQRNNVFRDYASGEWLINISLFWDLHTQYYDLPIAETIAWDAVNIRLGGECEGDMACHVYNLNNTWGKYLSFYPHGVHASQAIQQIHDMFTVISEDTEDTYFLATTDAEYMADFHEGMTQLRNTLTPCEDSKKQAVLQLMDKIESPQ